MGREDAGGQRGAAAPGIEPERVSGWLREHGVDLAPPVAFALLPGGRSNLTFRATDVRGRSVVVRRPPLHSVLPSAHDVAREYRIMAALAPTPVPVPPALALCEDPSVTGAPFAVTAFVDGHVLRAASAPAVAAVAPDARDRVATALVDTLVALHAVDPDAVGLGSLGRKEDYVARQLRTWARQWEQSRDVDVPAVDEAHRRLSARIPAQRDAAIVHGDYRLDNVIVDAGGGVAAVVDWELCTLGDPLADVGLLLVYWGEAGDAFTALPDAPSTLPGFPSRRALAERYARACGRDLAELDYYRAFGYWKLAVVLAGVLARSRAGAYGAAGDDLDALAERVGLLAEASVETAALAGR